MQALPQAPSRTAVSLRSARTVQVCQLTKDKPSARHVPAYLCRAALQQLPASAAHPSSRGPARMCTQASGRSCVRAAASKPRMVLESQPMLSDLLTESTGPWQTIAWKAALDIALPILCLWGLLKLVDWAADQARVAIDARVAGEADVVEELKRRSTLTGLVLLALRTPAKFMLPPWLFAYTLRTALNIVDLLVNKYQPALPTLVDYGIKQVSAQLVPLDAALQTLLSISGVLFVTWFMVQLKDILVREVILVRAIRSGNKELERVYLPLSSLVTWAAATAAALSVASSLGLNLKPLLAVGGAGGIAAGFASQQLLLNVVAGVNIFLTRPFIAGDQVVFEGGANIEGTVEGVEITRTLLRTADGTLVALPNKLVSDLIVYNRTRTLESAPNLAAPIAAAAAPLRRVLCFTLQLKRELEPELNAIREDVRALLNEITKEQLIASGLAPDPAAASASASASASVAEAGSSSNGHGNGKQPTNGGLGTVEAAAAALAAAVGVAVADKEQDMNESSVTSADEAAPEPEPLLVSITLKQLTESQISLFVRCEMLLPGSSMMDAVERQTEATLITISGLVREKYGAVLLW